MTRHFSAANLAIDVAGAVGLELLRALKAALECLEASDPPKGGRTEGVCRLCRDAIAKAEEKP